jgi:hypothetical protein
LQVVDHAVAPEWQKIKILHFKSFLFFTFFIYILKA